MAEDDRAVMERLAALEAEVKADADAQRARKDAALAKLREKKAEADAEQAAARAVAASSSSSNALVRQRKTERASSADDNLSDLNGALELAGTANRVKKELTRKTGKGEKSWMVSGLASLMLGPIGWLYAGSLRESVPASAGWLALAALASKILPSMLLMPVLMVALPLSAIAGVVYALQFNRKGGRQRLFSDDKKKQLPVAK